MHHLTSCERILTSRPMRVHSHQCTSPSRADLFLVPQGQKDYGRCLRLSPCCMASSSSSPDSVKGAALRSNSRYTSSQSRRATANRQVRFRLLTIPVNLPHLSAGRDLRPSFLPESHQEDVERHGAPTNRVVLHRRRRQQHAHA